MVNSKHLLVLLTGLSLLTGCLKQQDCYEDSGIITGFDARKCMCCGGWFVEIEDSTWRFDQFPEGCAINPDSITYPLPVYLDWEEKDPKCLGDEIVVTRMKVKE